MWGNYSGEYKNAGAEMKLRAERRLGEMLGENPEIHAGGNQTKLHDVTLEELGITKIQSHRWQSESSIPNDLFEQYLQVTKESEIEITTNGLLRHWSKYKTSQKNIIPLPKGIFNVIYADPPWQYDNQIKNWGPTNLHYETLSLEEISYYTDKTGREITECFADDSVLFLWVTNPFLEAGLSLVCNWTFDYKTNIVWVKTNIKRPGSGFWIRGRHELLFISGRGSFLPKQKGKSPIGSIVNWDDVLLADQRNHSQKPDEVYQLIETMYPQCKYLELFARNTRPGWESWGDVSSNKDR